jgi:Lon protease-like protein
VTAPSGDVTEEIPLFPLGVVLFPGGWLPLRIFETRYVDMVRRCMREERGFGVVLIREGAEVGPAQIYDVGTLARIVDFHQLPDGLLGLTCRGAQRFRIRHRRQQTDGLNLGEVQWLAAEPALSVPERHVHLSELLRRVMPQLGEPYSSMEMNLDDAAWVGHRIAEILPMAAADKQFCLELQDPIERLDALGARARA